MVSWPVNVIAVVFFYILEKLFQIKLILWYWPSCRLALTRLVLMVLLTPPPLKIMQLRWRWWWPFCSLFSGDGQSLAWLVIPSDAPQQLVASIPVQYHRSNIEKPDVYVASDKFRASWSAYMSVIAPCSACLFAQKQKSQWWYIMIYEIRPKAAIFQSNLHTACMSSWKPPKDGKI